MKILLVESKSLWNKYIRSGIISIMFISYTISRIYFVFVSPRHTHPALIISRWGLKDISESSQKPHFKLDATAEMVMRFKMRNVYCLRSAAPFVVIYFLDDSLTHGDIASHLDTCGTETVNQTGNCGFCLAVLCVEDCTRKVDVFLLQ